MKQNLISLTLIMFLLISCGGSDYRSNLDTYQVKIKLYLDGGNTFEKTYTLDEKSAETLHIMYITTGTFGGSGYSALVRCKAINSWSVQCCDWILERNVINFQILERRKI